MSKMTREEYLQEFALMIDEITSKDGARYDALCRISEKFLKPYIERLCYKYPSLRQLGIEDDIYHDVIISLIKSCVDKFLYREEQLNDDAEGFLRWIYTVTRNIVTDNAKRYGVKSCNEISMVSEEGETLDIPTDENPLASIEIRETLKECFRAVMSNESSVYITFTWILRAIVLTKCDMSMIGTDEEYTHIESKANGLVVSTFCDLTLNEIYAIILLETKNMPWMEITEADNRKILEKLSEQIDGEVLGDKKYSSFFMKKGGKATVSDWINRVNMRIIKTVNTDR